MSWGTTYGLPRHATVERARWRQQRRQRAHTLFVAARGDAETERPPGWRMTFFSVGGYPLSVMFLSTAAVWGTVVAVLLPVTYIQPLLAFAVWLVMTAGVAVIVDDWDRRRVLRTDLADRALLAEVDR